MAAAAAVVLDAILNQRTPIMERSKLAVTPAIYLILALLNERWMARRRLSCCACGGGPMFDSHIETPLHGSETTTCYPVLFRYVDRNIPH